MPAILGRIHQRFQTPDVSTVLMGTLSIVWYVGLTLVSENILFDSIAALGLMIAFYYGITGFACAIYCRRELFKSVKNFLFVGVAPVIGAVLLGYLFVKALIDYSDPANSYTGASWFGVAPPAVIGVGFLVLGVVLLFVWRRYQREPFFLRRREVARPGLLEESPVDVPAEPALAESE
jgi:amino acid transporter